eukprot:3335667-Amphidinium_carterae.1
MKTYKTGRYTSLLDHGGGIFNGRRIQQFKYGFTLTMEDYIDQKLQPVVIAKHRKGDHEAALDNREKEMYRTILM